MGYILNVTREIDNFFPGMFSYLNVRVYDEEATDLLAHWNETYNFIVKAKYVKNKPVLLSWWAVMQVLKEKTYRL